MFNQTEKQPLCLDSRTTFSLFPTKPPRILRTRSLTVSLNLGRIADNLETVDTVLHKHDATNAALIKEDAISAEASERDMTPLEAFKAYPQSIFWSFCVSLCLIMEGYDTTCEILRRWSLI